jgi:hypothetical protein
VTVIITKNSYDLKAVSVLLCCATLLTLTTATRSAEAWCRSTTIRPRTAGDCSMNGAGLLWCTPCNGFSVHSSGAPDIDIADIRAAVVVAAATWGQQDCDGAGTQPTFAFQLIGDTTAPTGYVSGGANANTVSFNTLWHPDANHQSQVIAITLTTFNNQTGELLDADIEMNQRSDLNPDGFHFVTAAPTPDDADLSTIIRHEMGHALGLGHSPEMASIMYFSAGRGEVRMITADDVEGLCDIYGPAGSSRRPNRFCDSVTPVIAPSDCIGRMPVPYGGYAPDQYGGRVVGGCAVSHSASQPWSHSTTAKTIATLSVLALSATYVRRRTRRR